MNPAADIGILLNKLEAINAVVKRKEEGIIFTKPFITFMIKCIKDDTIPLRTADHYRTAMQRYSPLLGLLSNKEVYSLMVLIEYHIENAGRRITAEGA